MKKIVSLILFLTISFSLFPQEKEKDSTEIFKKIEDYSKKRKLTKAIYSWVFKDPDKKTQDKKPQYRRSPDYRKYSGKIIRKIIIETKDPFGFSFVDTTKTPDTWLERFGNSVHIKSGEMAIKNFLLLKEGQPLDSLLASESARLLRSQKYIREVEIIPKEIAHSADSVDIVVTSLDSWSLIPEGSVSPSTTKVRLTEHNFIGTGHQVKMGYFYRHKEKKDGFEALYSVPNFKNTFISATAGYAIDYDDYYRKNFSIDRIFESPFTRWAGGIFLEERSTWRPFPGDSTLFEEKGVKYIAQDYWAGYSFQPFGGDSERERTTNIITALRALIVDYKKRLPHEYDSISYFSGENLFLSSIGITSRQFVRDHHIFQDGITEDVPIGILFSMTGGYQRKNRTNRLYLGSRASLGNYYGWGFLSVNLEAGSFFKKSKLEQTAISLQINYFSNLIDLGNKWKLRQFIKPQIVLGFNRLNSPADRLTLSEQPYFNGVEGKLYDNHYTGVIRGFESPVYGTRKYVLETQTQFYSPWVWLGFRINPFANITLGMITDNDRNYGSNKLYSSFGIGFLIRNDYLVFNTFQMSFAFYPEIPGQGKGIFKPNAFNTEDFGFQEFQINKPRLIHYR